MVIESHYNSNFYSIPFNSWAGFFLASHNNFIDTNPRAPGWVDEDANFLKKIAKFWKPRSGGTNLIKFNLTRSSKVVSKSAALKSTKTAGEFFIFANFFKPEIHADKVAKSRWKMKKNHHWNLTPTSFIKILKLVFVKTQSRWWGLRLRRETKRGRITRRFN